MGDIMDRFTWKAPDGTYQIDDYRAVHTTTCFDENFKNAFDIYEGKAIDKLGQYEDTGLTPEEFKESVDFVLELNAKVHTVIKDLKYYLDTNEENGVVYIPKFVIEKMIDEKLKTNF